MLKALIVGLVFFIIGVPTVEASSSQVTIGSKRFGELLDRHRVLLSKHVEVGESSRNAKLGIDAVFFWDASANSLSRPSIVRPHCFVKQPIRPFQKLFVVRAKFFLTGTCWHITESYRKSTRCLDLLKSVVRIFVDNSNGDINRNISCRGFRLCF